MQPESFFFASFSFLRKKESGECLAEENHQKVVSADAVEEPDESDEPRPGVEDEAEVAEAVEVSEEEAIFLWTPFRYRHS